MAKKITDYPLYRWRYIIGYSLVGLLIIEMLIVAALYIPGGLSNEEMNTTVTSSFLQLIPFSPETVINLPYHAVQKGMFTLFGITTLTIKLPSLIFGILSILGLVLLLQMWFRKNIALVSTILAVTTTQFIVITQHGTPLIMPLFWTVWILVSAMMVTRGAQLGTLWKVALFCLSALSLYTPLGVYVLIALVSAVILHPHLRYTVRKLSKIKIVFGIICATLLLTPLLYALIKQPAIGLVLLGLPSQFPSLSENIVLLYHLYFDFFSVHTGIFISPLYSLTTLLIIGLGFIRLLRAKYTARSYIISITLLLFLPVIILNPEQTTVIFVPLILLLGYGVLSLFEGWYRLFPRNPYARIVGLIPLALLVISMVLTGVSRYGYNYYYAPALASQFSNDLRILQKHNKNKNIIVVVSPSENSFYSAVARYDKQLRVTVTPPPDTEENKIVYTHAARQILPKKIPSQILTNRTYHESDRFYIYKTDEK